MNNQNIKPTPKSLRETICEACAKEIDEIYELLKKEAIYGNEVVAISVRKSSSKHILQYFKEKGFEISRKGLRYQIPGRLIR